MIDLKIDRDDTIPEILVALLYDDLIKKLIVSGSLWVIGPVAPITKYFLKKILKWIVGDGYMLARFFKVDLDVAKEIKEVRETKQALREAQQKGDPDEIKKRREEYLNKFRDAIKLRHN